MSSRLGVLLWLLLLLAFGDVDRNCDPNANIDMDFLTRDFIEL